MRRFLVAAALAHAGCGVSQELYSARTSELDRCQSEQTRANADLAAARTRLDEASLARDRLSDESLKLRTECADCGSKLQATGQELADLRRAHEQAVERADRYRALVAKLRPGIAAGTVAVALRKNRIVLKLSDQLLFDSDKGELSSAGQAALRQVAGALREVPERDFLVAGHTDNQPIKGASFRSNWELSAARAVTVVRFLQSEGVDPRRLAAAGYSEFDSVARNDTDQERALNRRIEIVVMPNLEELPTIDPQSGAAPTPESTAPAASPPPPPAPPTR